MCAERLAQFGRKSASEQRCEDEAMRLLTSWYRTTKEDIWKNHPVQMGTVVRELQFEEAHGHFHGSHLVFELPDANPRVSKPVTYCLYREKETGKVAIGEPAVVVDVEESGVRAWVW